MIGEFPFFFRERRPPGEVAPEPSPRAVPIELGIGVRLPPREELATSYRLGDDGIEPIAVVGTERGENRAGSAEAENGGDADASRGGGVIAGGTANCSEPVEKVLFAGTAICRTEIAGRILAGVFFPGRVEVGGKLAKAFAEVDVVAGPCGGRRRVDAEPATSAEPHFHGRGRRVEGDEQHGLLGGIAHHAGIEHAIAEPFEPNGGTRQPIAGFGAGEPVGRERNVPEE